MQTKHTPGPWFVDGMEIVSALGSDSGDGCQACDVHRWTIAEISELEAAVEGLGLVQLGHDVKLANARLIAAAPELLSVALAVEDLAERIDHEPDSALGELVARARAAIAKATGAEA